MTSCYYKQMLEEARIQQPKPSASPRKAKKESKKGESPLGTLSILLALQNNSGNTQSWEMFDWAGEKMAMRNPNVFEGAASCPYLVTPDHKAGLENVGVGCSLELLGEFSI